MLPATDRSPAATSSQSPGRRLISRIASPFAAKTRNLTDFHVEVASPHKQFSPGETVTGCVRLRVNKPTRVTHLVVCLHGYVQVYKNPGSPSADGSRANNALIATGRGSRSGEYFGNGFASLFEDETVLCGDGRLGEGVYQFNFELDFPDRDLPSSISFERGRIQYKVTATLTRPTAISPTIQAEHKVFFVERIDIARLFPPKARTITLEAISRKTRVKTQARKLADASERRSRKGDSVQPGEERRNSHSSSAQSVQVDGSLPRSQSPSEISFDSRLSGQGQHDSSNTGSPRPSDASKTTSCRASFPAKKISATVESLQGGCLRGDGVPIRVTVNHTKYVKSLYGVIITLYRQARVDMHPAIPLGPTEKGKEGKYEDYYPKSISGLGGLSLSGAGSSHVFRKDLSQIMLPLIVNPDSLTAEVNGKVHVPEEAFPTISTVPGAMISFKYYVEVVVDIQGKLSSHDRNMSNLGGLASTISGAAGMEGMDGERSAFNPFGSPVIDTTPIRRDKGVVACTFEVIVGTQDSERRKGKRKADANMQPNSQPPVSPQSQFIAPSPQQTQTAAGAEREDSNAQNGYWYNTSSGPGYQYQWNDADYHEAYEHTNYHHYDALYQHQTHLVPMPEVEDESQLPEKERMRRAEARLLPSQPPGALHTDEAAGPTAPYIPEEQDANGFPSQAPHINLLAAPAVQASSSRRSLVATPAPAGAPRTPEYEPRDHVAGPATGDDKKELQRRQLETVTSAPPADDLGPDEAGPSAPTLREDDELYNITNDSHADASASSGLPRYER